MFNNWRKKRKARNLYRKGTSKSIAGEANEAIVLLTEAIKLDPSNLDSFMNRGLSYLDNEDYDKAIKDFTQIVDDKKYKWLAHYNRGVVYMKKNEYNLALADYNKSIEGNKSDCSSYLNRGFIYYERQKYQMAIEDISKAIKLGCKKEGYAIKAVIYKKTEEYTLAIKDWTKLLRLQPKEAIALCSRGA